jgi:hypothetical protein
VDEPERAPEPMDIATAGLASAAAVVERMLELGRAASSGLWLRLPPNGVEAALPLGGPDAGDGEGDDGAPPDPLGRARQARRFRADAERVVELYADFTRMLVDGAASLAEQAAGLPATNGRAAGADVLVLGPASAGATTTTTAWLHVLDGPTAPPAPLHASDLLSHAGAVVKATSVRCTPDHLDTSTARQAAEVRVTVTVPKGTAPGTYHGHLLATGLPEVVLALRLEVVA